MEHLDYLNFFYYTRKLEMGDLLGDTYVGFAAAETAKEKFMFTYNLLKKDLMQVPKLTDQFWKLQPEIILSLRIKGNDCFKKKQYSLAIEHYNICVIHSERGTLPYALALANRAAGFFYTENYEYCLKDVHRALESNYPTSTIYKLYERAGDAERMLGHEELAVKNYSECLKYLDKSVMSDKEKYNYKTKIMESIDICASVEEFVTFKKMILESKTKTAELLGGQNESIPALSKHLELKCTKEMGRGVFATSDINPGDVVAIDDPLIYVPASISNFVCQYANCLKFSLAFIRCPKCSYVYCDEECMQKAFEDGHKEACSILNLSLSIPGSIRVNRLVMEWFLKANFKMGLAKYVMLVKNARNTKIDPMTKGFDVNGKYKSDSFLTLYTLESGESKISMDLLFFYNCVAVEMVMTLMVNDFKIPKSYLGIVGESLVHMLYVVDINYWKYIVHFSSKPLILNTEGTNSSLVGLFSSIFLFNHSCDANVRRENVFKTKSSVLKAVQFIPKGKQLFISYGVNFSQHCQEFRENYLNRRFHFKCLCQPCLEKWPVYRYIPERISSLNSLHPDKADIVTLECKKFMEFRLTVHPEDRHQHLNYLNYFMKFLILNVRRPFSLYESCLDIIMAIHNMITDVKSSEMVNYDR